MSNKLSSVIYNYRRYKADQVLTHTQLNESISYFEDQDRLTRLALHGVGIVHGFKVSLDEGGEVPQVTIDQGVGITTDGDLLLLHEEVPESEPLENTIGIEGLSYSHFREFSDENANYTPYFFPGGEQMPLWELCQEGDEEAQLLEELPGWKDKVFLLYLECYPKPQDICGDINCDNQGIEQVSRLRILLMDEGQAESLISHDPIFLRKRKVGEALNALSSLQLLKVVHQKENSLSMLQMDRLYREAIFEGNTLADLQAGLHLISSEFGFLLQQDASLAGLISQLDELLLLHFSIEEEESYQYQQYRYLLMKDLIGTFNKLLKALVEFDSWPNPDVNAFPKHLLLGKIEDQAFGHDFYPSPALSDAELQQNKIISLIRKIFHLLDSFDLNVSGGLRIIPSGLNHADGSFPSIPFYYQPNPELAFHWQWPAAPVSFHYDMGSNPLLMEYNGLDRYLIGGHLETDAESTFQSIQSMVKQFGLDFKVYHFDLTVNSSDFSAFLDKHPSLRSIGGVPKSGTYVLLSNENQVFGDLALDYRVVAASGETNFGHIRVAACSYPWISSLKYLNNLSRSLKGSPRRSGIQPENYRLVVRDYVINGHPMISGPVTLTIPLEAVARRRMHAITETLNERFPDGLVFDFDEVLKRLVISRPFDDEFRIGFVDITLNINSPLYTYTQDGMEKADQTFRLDAIRCEEVRKYRSSTYLQLQEEFAPVNKDDDYGEYKGKWREWYWLIEQLKTDARFTGSNKPRIPQTFDDLPASLQRIITQIRNVLEQSEISHQLYLTGDWVTGSWASIEMINDYRNTSNTSDLIFRFLNLRSKLHEKEQATKASLFIVLTREADRASMETLMEDWTDVADIYIEGPRTGGRRRVIDGIAEKIRL
ncbi:hypothetical protein [Cyclobacterium jeungdonense]|uniref:Uncharacterized protein n=1 Tax=Cyclobacterium jeungdonense TaxID=708087 RepID=A0ABT8CBS7_9BACT|nr:hypothetical protein [Cyclobacterium jeungdonense]MDN3689966.1 hypothetical protein [Cyclobacterium jeungdonense]